MTNTGPIPPALRAIEIVAFPGVQLLDVAGPLQVFESANAIVARCGGPVPYSTSVVAKSVVVVASAGLGLLTRKLPRTDRTIDTLIVPGGAGVDAACADARLVRWLASRARHARRVASVCSGAFLLGAAGLLDGKRVTTHWEECERLARRFPTARVESDPIFIRDGTTWTSAGVTAGIDQALAMVEEDIGHRAAMAVARDLVVFLKRPGGQAQYSVALALQSEDRSFDRLNAWIAGHLSEDLAVPHLASRAAMSERSFLRRYTASMGITPARAVAKMRVEAARAQLASTRTPVKRIAERCGFGSEEAFRKRFLREVGVPPSDYRARFSATWARERDAGRGLGAPLI
jgi:transcriptional regulator GlxA family with amidase domain